MEKNESAGTGRKRRPSLRIVIWSVVAMILGIVAMFVSMTFMTAKLLDQSVRISTRQTVDLGINIISDRLDSVEQFIWSNLITDDNLISLRERKYKNRAQLYQLIVDNLSQYGNYYPDMDAVFFYDETENLLMVKIWGGESKKLLWDDSAWRAQILRTQLKESCSEENSDSWIVLNIDGVEIVVYFREYKGQYFGMFLRTDALLDLIASETSEEQIHTLTDENGKEITGDQQRTFDLGARSIREDGIAYMLVCDRIGNMPVWSCTLVPSSGIQGLMENWAFYWIALLTISAALLFFIIYVFRHYLTRPLRQLNEGIDRFSGGQLETKVTDDVSCLEVGRVIDNFNGMTDQIRELKITQYEQEIRNRDIYLKYLQIQMNPHFFLNILNVIYMLSMKGNVEKIRTVTMDLVKYTRYILSTKEALVSLKEEMDFVQNYVSIQKIRIPYPSEVIYEGYTEEIYGFRVPPLSIQTFVENAFKYAVSAENMIRIVVSFTHRGKELLVVIEDHGEGFSSEMLTQLNDENSLEQDENGKHIGIRNVLGRMRMLYKDGFSWKVSNRADGGGRIEIVIPEI